MMRAISRQAMVGATAALVLAGCSSRRRAADVAAPAPKPAVPNQPVPLANVLVLEYAGTPPPDTSVTIRAGEQRTVVLRSGPPELVVFAEVTFPPTALGPDTGATATVRLHPRPGIYGLDIESDRPFASARLVFKYARYFSAPAAARRRYGSDAAYEAVLSIGRLLPDARVLFLPAEHPASDNLAAEIPGPGSYIVGAPQ